ncbi:MAG: recombination-associated protein RdgC [Desulfobacterales bacterium]|nr:recombination-associated protein RdgC [Desulfobacterales bacterium]MDJ0873972.1 recombination-associated protein RdgC [Desulfobacterales bacterium]
MGLLSTSVSITQYRVEGQIKAPVLDTIRAGLKKHTIDEIDNETSEQVVGWTPFENPFTPNFDTADIVIDTTFVFSLRIDKKSIPAKIVTKHLNLEMTRRLAESNRDFLSRAEKKEIKERVVNVLSTRIPATPNVYDLTWDYEAGRLWFFTNLKSANEALESLFTQSFKLSLIRLFPYTAAEFNPDLTGPEKDHLNQLKPTLFVD